MTLELFTQGLSLFSALVMLTFIIYMALGLRKVNKTPERSSHRAKIIVIMCLFISVLEYVNGDPINSSVWIFNSSIWITVYFDRLKLISRK